MVTIAQRLNVLIVVLKLFQTVAVTSMVHSSIMLEIIATDWTVLCTKETGYYLAQCAQNEQTLANNNNFYELKI
jgi:hypothetical protein